MSNKGKIDGRYITVNVLLIIGIQVSILTFISIDLIVIKTTIKLVK